jgi:hypothetical protein
VTSPGLGRPGGSPPLDRAASEAIEAARARAGIGQGPAFPFARRVVLTDEQREEVLKQAKDEACRLCGGIHAAPNSPACPRLRTFELNPDGKVIKGEFWGDGYWDASRILFVADAAETGEDDDGDEG